MELSKILQEQADQLRQESILNAFARKHPPRIKPKKKKSRDLIAEAEYEILNGRKLTTKSPNLEG